MDILIGALLEWIGSKSSYATAGIPAPAVIEMSPAELTREYYTDVPAMVPADGVDDRVLALYAAREDRGPTIYILGAAHVDDAEFFDDPHDNPLWREMLLHELVHHVQWQTGAVDHWACQSAGETEAYLLGGQYLKQTGTTDPMPNRRFWAHIYARC